MQWSLQMSINMAQAQATANSKKVVLQKPETLNSKHERNDGYLHK